MRGGRRLGAGRKPKPLADHLHEGTYRPHRHGRVDQEGRGIVAGAGARRPPMPSGLDARAKRAWKVLLKDLESAGLLDVADAPLYEAFVVMLSRAQCARALIDRDGMLVASPREGLLVANPMIRAERDALKLLEQLADQLAVGMRTRAALGMAIVRGAAVGPGA